MRVIRNHPDDYWPSPAHEDMLRAALGDGPEAQAAWLRWQSGHASGAADAANQRLLPLVHYNLSKCGYADASLQGLRRERIQTQIRNRAVFVVLDHALQSLGDNKVPRQTRAPQRHGYSASSPGVYFSSITKP